LARGGGCWGEEHPETLRSASNLAYSLSGQGKHAEAEEMLQAALEVSRRVLGAGHPSTLAYAENLQRLRSDMRAEQPTKRGSKPATPAASPLSATALAEAAAKAASAEAELLAMLELEAGAAGSAKGKAKGNKTKRG
jgi:hypothetical protein